jgi:UDP-N-acetylmuramoylalanine--D-glutamate ligase
MIGFINLRSKIMIKLSRYSGKKIAVLGLARSGIAAIKSLEAGGADFIAWDDNPKVLKDNPNLNLQPPEDWNFESLNALIVSPAIPLKNNANGAVKLAKEHNIRITNDISLLMEANPKARFIGITGTNGKSTTTALMAHCLSELKQQVQCGGNIGVASLELEPLSADGFYVLELSSYQLEGMDYGKLDIAILLNVTPDHLERHGNMENYVEAKSRIFKGQIAGDGAIIALDDEYCANVVKHLPNPTTISVKNQRADYYMEGAKLIDKSGYELDLSLMQSLQGSHNHQNALAVYAALRHLNFAPQAIADAMQSFKGLAHRMEVIAKHDGVTWVNDSKATNADAAWQSLNTYQNIHWIVGGVLKHGGIDSLAPLKSHIKCAYIIGKDFETLEHSLQKMQIPYSICGTMQKAVEEANNNARGNQNDVVLLAPSAASFDQYNNFEERGDDFRNLVLKLTQNFSKLNFG